MKATIEACLQSVERREDGFVARFMFPAHLPVFAGHFPGFPLVPGVFVVEAVRTAAERFQQRSLRIARVHDAKFKAEIGPDVPVCVDGNVRGDTCSAVVRVAGDVAAEIRLELAGS